MPRGIPAAMLTTIRTDAFKFALLCKIARVDGTVITMTTWGTSLDADLEGSGDIRTYMPADLRGISAFSAQLNAAIDDSDLDVSIDGTYFISDDIRRGFFNAAVITIGYVNPDNPTEAWLNRKYEMGQVKVEGISAKFELLGPEKRLETAIGRPLTLNCPWRFTDVNCGVVAYHETATVTAVTDGRTFTASGISIANDYFGEGDLLWLTGRNEGERHRIKTDNGSGLITQHFPCLDLPQIGDTFDATPGCRKRLAEDCVAKWSNGNRFGGFPFLAPENVTATAPKGKASN